MRMRNYLLISASIMACAAASPALSQTASTPEADSGAIEQIVVTAERHESTVQKTAAAITVRSGEELLAQGRYSLANILEDVPGVSGGAATNSLASFGSGSDNPSAGLTIRGIQSNIGSGGDITSTAAAAALYVDDVYNGVGGGYDINRVEVLRGPQGTLYGRSATSGVVAIHTNDPNLSDYGADVTAEIGNFNLKHYAGDANIPIISDQLALRVSANSYYRDSYFTTDGGGRLMSNDERVKLLYQPTDNFSAMIGYARSANYTRSDGITFTEVEPNQFTATTTDRIPDGHNISQQVWGNFKLNLGGVNITYIPAYRTFSQKAEEYTIGGPTPFHQYISTGPDHFLTQELRIASDNDSSLRWQAGATYYSNVLHESDLTEDLDAATLAPVRVGEVYTTKKSTKELGLFAEATWAFMPDTRLTAGVRWDTTKVVAAELFGNGAATPPYAVTYLTLTPQDGTRKFNNFTYKARLEHDLTPENLVYASVSSGFSPGDVSVSTNASYQPEILKLEAETLTAYELGSKNRFWDDRLQVNGAVYYYDYGGYQVANIDIGTYPPVFTSMNLPVTSYGAELEVQARPWENGQLSGSLEYSKGRYHDIPAAYAQYFYYHTIPGVAPFRANLDYNHTIPLGGSMTLLLDGTLHYYSAYNPSQLDVSSGATLIAHGSVTALGATGAQMDHNGDEATGDVNVTLNLADGKYSLTGYVRNIGDTRFKETASVSVSPVGASTTATFNDPRTYGLVATAHF